MTAKPVYTGETSEVDASLIASTLPCDMEIIREKFASCKFGMEIRMEAQERQVVFVIADISGYTRFIISNEKALAHSQIIIRELVSTLIEEIKVPLSLIRIEGDAIFLYALKDDPQHAWDRVEKSLVFNIMRFFKAFADKLAEFTIHKICSCNACNNVDRLRLKVIVHSGSAAFFKLNGHQEVTGRDAIVVHRLLKNSVGAEEYVLLTEPAYRDLSLPHGEVEQSEETYDELGTIKTYIYYPPAPEPYVPDRHSGLPSIFVESLREEISREYALVAQYPELGFHFHTGRRLAELLDYDQEWLDGLPERVIESFAGTGNPFKLGEIKPGDHVVDLGCGAGLDCIIAAGMVAPDGEVIGVDMTPEMIEKARSNAATTRTRNVSFRQGFNEELPIPDGWADVLISNGVLNLSANKDQVFSEIYRVLKPGGRVQIADILVQKVIPESAKRNIDLWAG